MTTKAKDYLADSSKHRLPFGQEKTRNNSEWRKCPDCGVDHGQIHRMGCDWEECPYCGGQLITCGCWLHVSDELLEELAVMPEVNP